MTSKANYHATRYALPFLQVYIVFNRLIFSHLNFCPGWRFRL